MTAELAKLARSHELRLLALILEVAGMEAKSMVAPRRPPAARPPPASGSQTLEG